MAYGSGGANLKSLGVLWDFGTLNGLDDRSLLARFVERRDDSAELAFEALVRRHGPMVLGVSEALLGNRQAAEDAFQAVFLVLAKKARSIRDPDRLGPWLHGVARKTAHESRKREERRRKRERQGPTMPLDRTSPPDRALLRSEEAETLHGEIARLPERYREAVILCDLEGLTHQEAAGRLGCPTGTIAVRIIRARERLKRRLTLRGLDPSSPLAILALRSGISARLMDSTVRASMAGGFASASVSVSVSAVSLAEGVRWTMTLAKAKTATVSLILVFALAAGYGASSGIAGPKPDDPPAPLVERAIARAEIQQVRDYEDFTGKTEPAGPEEILARVAGVLEKVHAPDGKHVKAGEVLFELGRKEYEIQQIKAWATMFDAEANRDAAKVEAETYIPDPKKDPATIWKERLLAGEKLATFEGILTHCQEMARSSALVFDSTWIKAPFDGEISRSLVKVGDQIEPGLTVLATIVSPDRAGVGFEIDERTFLKLRFLKRDELFKGKIDLPVQLALADEEAFGHSGTLQFSGYALDPKTSTAKLRAVVANENRRIVPGLFARVRLSVSEPHLALVVPEASIATEGQRKLVQILDENDVVEPRTVKLGQPHEGFRVILEGLKAGDRVVTEHPADLKPGTSIKSRLIAK